MADFLRLIDVNAGGLRLKKGQGILHRRDVVFWEPIAGVPQEGCTGLEL